MHRRCDAPNLSRRAVEGPGLRAVAETESGRPAVRQPGQTTPRGSGLTAVRDKTPAGHARVHVRANPDHARGEVMVPVQGLEPRTTRI